MMTKEQILETFGGKPSGALKLMMEGLLDPDRPFKINMGTFGRAGKVCYGCAATSASWKIHEKLNEKFIIEDTERWRITKEDHDEWRAIIDFEKAVDYARRGRMLSLFEYCGLNTDTHEFYSRIDMGNYDWESQILALKILIEEMEKAGY